MTRRDYDIIGCFHGLDGKAMYSHVAQVSTDSTSYLSDFIDEFEPVAPKGAGSLCALVSVQRSSEGHAATMALVNC